MSLCLLYCSWLFLESSLSVQTGLLRKVTWAWFHCLRAPFGPCSSVLPLLPVSELATRETCSPRGRLGNRTFVSIFNLFTKPDAWIDHSYWFGILWHPRNSNCCYLWQYRGMYGSRRDVPNVCDVFLCIYWFTVIPLLASIGWAVHPVVLFWCRNVLFCDSTKLKLLKINHVDWSGVLLWSV